MPKKSPRTRKQLDEHYAWSKRTLRHGWHTCGVGSARYGWASYTAAGDCSFEGRSLDAVKRKIARKR